MTMHRDNYPTGETRTVRRQVMELEPARADALGRPPQAHVVVESQERVWTHWESNASSGDTQGWVTRQFWRESLDGDRLG
jgi:hypothetical protein